MTIRWPSLPMDQQFDQENILSTFQDQRLRELLYTSSPSVYKEFERWEQNKLDQKKCKKLKQSIYKYSLRMRYRATPFGLLSQLGTAKIKELSKGFTIDGSRRISRLDGHLIQEIIGKLEALEEIWPHLSFQANNSIYKRGQELRYYKQRKIQSLPVTQIGKLDSDSILERLLLFCKSNRKGKEIDTYLKKYCNNQKERESYLKGLIELQLLRSNLKVALSSGDQLSRIICILQSIREEVGSSIMPLNKLYSELVRIQLRLIRIDNQKGIRVSAYRALHHQIAKIPLDVEEDQLVQICRFGELKSRENDLSFDFPSQDEFAEVVNFLAQLKQSTSNEKLNSFRARFQRRYGDEMPLLMEVMDPELGLGYAEQSSHLAGNSPMLEEIRLKGKAKKTSRKEQELPKKLIESLSKSIHAGNSEIKLIPEDFKGTPQLKGLPESFSAVLKVAELDDGEKVVYIKDLGGHHALHYLGRFIDNSRSIHDLAKEIAAHEENCMRNKQLVQCYHGYPSRMENLSKRPPLYRDSLHLLDNPDQQITRYDWHNIQVKLERDRLVLVDKNSGREIVPRISTALDFKINTIPLHHFIGDLQSQNSLNDLNFSWGQWESHFTHLPRLRFGKFIIKAEQWVFHSKYVKEELKNTDLRRWRTKHRIPERCIYAEGDKEILIDFNAQAGRDLFSSLLQRSRNIELQEYLKPLKGLIRDKAGREYEHEIVVSILNMAKKEEPTYQALAQNRKKDFTTFCEKKDLNHWLYFKLYANPLFSERLIGKLYPLINSLRRKSLVKKWFFIRYSDPDHHLRLRIQCTEEKFIGQVFQHMNKGFKDFEDDGSIWKVQLDQYQAESNRYGRAGVRLCETLFYHDSETVIRYLNTFKGNKREVYRWQMAVLMIHDWFELFQLSNLHRIQLLESWCNGFKSEFHFEQASKHSLAKQWRAKRSSLKMLIKRDQLRGLESKLLNAIVAERSLKMTSTSDALIRMGAQNRLEIPMAELLNSLSHMSCNRLFPHGSRANEFVIYDLLWNYYRAELAMKKKENKVV